MGQMLAEGEFQREGRRLLSRLSRTAGFLQKSKTSYMGTPQYLLYSQRNKGVKPVGAIDVLLVQKCLDHLLLAETDKNRFEITSLGRRWAKGEVLNGGDMEVARHAGQPPLRGQANDSPIGWLAKRKTKDGPPFLSPLHVEAADIFRRDFEMSQLMPSVTSSWSPVYASRQERRGAARPDALPECDRLLAARQRFNRAVETLGPELTDLMLEICCLMRGLEAAEQRLGWPKRSAKIVLRIGLGRLINHYQLGGRSVDAKKPAQIKSWGADGYRPDILAQGED